MNANSSQSSAYACTPPLALDQYQSHLKFNGRAPRTMAELLTAKADYEHRRRLAEIKAVTAKLDQLQAFAAPLAAKGINLTHRDINSYNGKKLRIHSQILVSRDDKLCAALIELGFKEVERTDYGRDHSTAVLKYGRALLVELDVSRAPEAVAQ